MLRPFPGKLSLLENSVHRAGVGGAVCPCHFTYSPLMTMLHLSASVPVNDKSKGPDVTLVSFACDSFHSQIRNNSPYPFWAGQMSSPQWATLILNSWHLSHWKNHHSRFSQGVWLGEGRVRMTGQFIIRLFTRTRAGIPGYHCRTVSLQ